MTFVVVVAVCSSNHGRNPRGGGTGGTIPQKFWVGGRHSPYPPNKLSAQLRKITICLDNRMKCNFYRLLQRNDSVNDERIVQFSHLWQSQSRAR